MTVTIEAATNESANVRRSATRKKNAAAKKAAKPAKPAKVVGVHVLPSGKFEVSIFLGAFDKLEDAVAAREAGLALRESLKAAPAPAPKKKAN